MKIETKYNIGDIVYIINRNKIESKKIKKITILDNGTGLCERFFLVYYTMHLSGDYKENDLFISEEAAIAEMAKRISEENKISEVDNILLDLLDQCTCNMLDDNLSNRTQYNAEAIAVMYLENKGLIKIIDGRFPQTKSIEFEVLK